jgi:arylsulfatase A-like enzyme
MRLLTMRGLRSLLPLAALLIGLGAHPGCSVSRQEGPPGVHRPNVVFITVDTLRVDRIGAYGSTSSRTPHLDALAARAVRFEHAYAAFPKTNPALSSLMTGRYPSAHGVRRNGTRLPQTELTLAEILKGAGYGTSAFMCNQVAVARYGLAQGFTLYDQDLPDAIPTRSSHERIAEHVVSAVLRWADASRPAAPFFLWVHFIDPHGPYTPPHFTLKAAPSGRTLPVSPTNGGENVIPAYQALPGVTDPVEFVERYEGEVDYLDGEAGRLIDGLKERGLLDDTLIVFAADHGESLGDHDLYFQHGSSLFEAQIHIPLLILGPGVEPGAVATSVGSVDVLPTILERLGLPLPADLQGVSLNGWLEGRPPPGGGAHIVFAELGRKRAAILGPLKLIWDGDRKIVDLFDVGADPVEARNIVASRPEELNVLLQAVMKFEKENTRDEAPDEDEETRKSLKSLGYID